MSSQSFAGLGVSKPVVAALAARGIENPFAVQKLVIADVLAGHDVLAQSPTGSGKTLAFGIPVADRIDPGDRRAAALVLAPTRELASQIVDELLPVVHARALKIAAVYGGVGIERQARRARDAHIVVATPGRLEDLIDRRVITLEHIRILVVDEGDRMLDMGFRPVLDRIVAQTPRERQTLFFSATLEGGAGAAAKDYTSNPRRHTHAVAPEKRGAVEHRFVHLAHEDKLPTLVTELSDPDHGRTLVFVRTKRGADRLVKRLKNSDVKAVAMHGDKTQSQRQKALASFEEGRVKTLVATDVAARGIDVENVTRVINFDMPEDRDAYVHRVGRTGRAGRSGAGVSFVMAEQLGDMKKIAADLGLSREFESSAPRQHRRSQSGSSTHPQARRPQRSRSARRSRSKSG
jgi:ATP-dependent RNA helicase RhlE